MSVTPMLKLNPVTKTLVAGCTEGMAFTTKALVDLCLTPIAGSKSGYAYFLSNDIPFVPTTLAPNAPSG